MHARAKKTTPAKKSKSEQMIVGFNAEQLKSPFLLRCGAILIDYILLISIPVISVLLGRMSGNDGARLLNSEISNVGWVITLLLILTNFLILPTFNGQSVGKMLTGLQITRLNGSPPGLGNVMLRHLIGYPITLLTGGLGYFIQVFNRSGRSLHDFIGQTTVVYGRRKIIRKRKLETKRAKEKKSKTLTKKKTKKSYGF